MGRPLTDIQRMALRGLAHKPDQIGIIDSEEKLAAAVVYMRLQDEGLAIASIQPSGGPIYMITPRGRTALREAGDD